MLTTGCYTLTSITSPTAVRNIYIKSSESSFNILIDIAFM